MAYLQLFGGLIYLLMGGDFLVRGSVALATRSRVPALIVGLTVVSLGTSLPELVVSIEAILAGYPGMAIGNVVGSNIANVLLVAGVPAILYPLSSDGGFERRNASIMLGASILFVVLCLVGDLDRVAGIILVSGMTVLTAYTVLTARSARRETEAASPMEMVLGLPNKSWMIGLFIGVGAIGLPVGARLMVDAAVEVAAQLGVSDAFVGLTVVAVGTSSLDLPVMLACALALSFLVWYRRSIGRLAGIVFVAGYVAYLVALLAKG